MGTHARPRRRVRAAALGTLAVGATLTGVGQTAAALDQSGAALADGTLSTEPVNFAASGLGAPVPVADVSSLDGSSAGKSVVVTKAGSSNGAAADSGADAGALLGAPLGGYGSYGGYGEYVTSGKAAGAKTAGTKAAGSDAAGQAVSAASSGVSQVKQVGPSAIAPRSNTAPASAGSSGSGTDAASADGAAPKTSTASWTAASTRGRNASGGGAGTSTAPATQFPSLPSLDAHLPLGTALPVPSLPTVASLTTTVNHAKSTLAGLLDEVAGLV